jgi:hypothetical protein
MQKTNSDEIRKLAVPFVCREREVARLQRLHAQHKHVLIVGPRGIGKTWLIRHLQASLGLLVCWQSTSFQAISNSLEGELGGNSQKQRVLPRKNDLLGVLTKANRAIAFDALGWTNLKLSSFLECLSERGPVWICCRSTELWDIGFFKPFLWKFVRVELHPFSLSETRALVEAAVQTGRVPPAALDEVGRLQKSSGGNPRILCDSLESLRRRPARRVPNKRKQGCDDASCVAPVGDLIRPGTL